MALNAHAVYASVHMSRREDLLMKGLLMKGLHVQQTGRAMTEHRLAVTQRLIEPWAAPASWRPCSGVGPSHDSDSAQLPAGPGRTAIWTGEGVPWQLALRPVKFPAR